MRRQKTVCMKCLRGYIDGKKACPHGVKEDPDNRAADPAMQLTPPCGATADDLKDFEPRIDECAP